MKYGAYWPEAATRWNHMTIKPERQHEFAAIAGRLYAHRDRYQEVEALTGVPWPLIAVLHLRESDADFHTYLGNGEPLNRRTRLVPKGRGPFATWEDGAVDALKYDGLTSLKDFRIEKQLWAAEGFNGWGYANRGLSSPYVWGGTNIQKPGKYVADGKWNGRVWDTQPGVAPILTSLAVLDPNIHFVRET